MRRALAAVMGIGVLGCGAGQDRAQFTPLERAEGQTQEGYTEAIYDLSGTQGQFGQVKVWSSGAYRDPDSGETVIHVGFELENGGKEPMVLEPGQVRLESVQTEEQVIRDVQVSSPAQGASVAPQSTGRAELAFVVPASVAPKKVRAFRVAWAVRTDGQQFTEFTPFARTEPSTYYVPVHGYYYPYYPWYLPYYDPLWVPRSRIVVVKRHYPRRVVVHGHRRGRR